MNSEPNSVNALGFSALRLTGGDIDGFFALALDNLIQFLLIITLCAEILKFPPEFTLQHILPAAACSVFLGNIFYAWQARKLTRERSETEAATALPYGVSTVALLANIFLVMLPTKHSIELMGLGSEEQARTVWQVGLAVGFLVGLGLCIGSVIADSIRRITPRAALLTTLAGIAISFLTVDFALRIFEQPMVAMLPMGIIWFSYLSGAQKLLGIPGTVWALLVGTLLAWLTHGLELSSPVHWEQVRVSRSMLGLWLPVPVAGDLIAGLSSPLLWPHLLGVVLPLVLSNVVGSLQNVESAKVGGDSFPMRSTLIASGVASMVGATLGSCFPNTIYVGHPSWKSMGARSSYSIMNGILFVLLSVFGGLYVVGALVPLEAGASIMLWIGIGVTVQAVRASPPGHVPAIAIGIIPAIAAWGLALMVKVMGTVEKVSASEQLVGKESLSAEFWYLVGGHFKGLAALSQGFLLTCMVWAAVAVYLIEQAYLRAAAWLGLASLLAFWGVIHAGALGRYGVSYDLRFAAGIEWAIGYFLCALVIGAMTLCRQGGCTASRRGQHEQ